MDGHAHCNKKCDKYPYETNYGIGNTGWWMLMVP